MRAMKWFISSLTKADYLLGAMVVCLDLHYDLMAESLSERPPGYDMYFWTPDQRAEMLQALEASQAIWKESSESSMEAYKASHILGIMLEKLKAPKQEPKTDGPTTNDVFAQFDEENLKPEHSAAMTLGMLSGGLSPNTAAMFNSMQSPGGTRYNVDMNMGDSSSGSGLTPNFGLDSSNPFGSINNVASPFSFFGGTGQGLMDMPANIDWEAWDTYVQNSNTVDPNFQFYPTSLDQAQLGLNPDGSPQQATDPSSTFGGNSVFMGANTPGR